MAAFVVVDLTILLTTVGARLDDIHPLSIALAVGFGACLIGLTLALSSGSSRWRINRRICRETALFGVRRQRGAVRIESVRGVHALGAAGAERWHVLIDSTDGPLALEVARGDAARLAQDTERAIAAVRGGQAAHGAERPLQRQG